MSPRDEVLLLLAMGFERAMRDYDGRDGDLDDRPVLVAVGNSRSHLAVEVKVRRVV